MTMFGLIFCRVHERNQTYDGQPVKEIGDKDHRDKRRTCEWHEEFLNKILSFYMNIVTF